MSHVVARRSARNFALLTSSPYDQRVVPTIRHVSVAFVLLAGCATQASALRDDNRKLNQSVSDLRDDRREQDLKLRDLEHQLDELRAQQVQTTLAAIPALPVEVVTPTSVAPARAERVVGVASDGGEIVYEGDAATGKAATLDDDSPAALPPSPRPQHHVLPVPVPTTSPSVDVAADTPAVTDRIEVTRHVPVAARGGRAHLRTSPDRDPPGERASATGDASAEYRAAVELLKGGKVDDAIAALRAFLVHYPHHDYADNAQYWLGEAFYVQKDFQKALGEFRATIETYPRGNKVPDALLKVGYCYQALGQTDKSRAVLEQVVNLYPKTEPAALAAKRLETP
jgi:tol-pal system protein YbgF